MYISPMNDHDYPSDENSHWGLSTALLHEMPPEDFEGDHEDGYELSIRNLSVAFVIGLAVVFLVFGVLS